MMNDLKDELYVQAICLREVILRTFEAKGKLDVTSKPIPKIRPIVEANKRMKVSNLGRFDTTAFISIVNFYKHEADLENNKALGALVIYIGEKYIIDLFAQMGYPGLDENNDSEMEDASGTLCNIIAGKFKLALKQLDFIELEMSHFSTYQNDVPDGVAYDYHQKRKYEISFEIDEEKAFIVELTMGSIPKVESSA